MSTIIQQKILIKFKRHKSAARINY